MYQVKFEDYGYANARVRAMKSALLKKDFYEQLIQIDDPRTLIETLEKTPYKEDIQETLLKGGKVGEIIDEALKRNLAKTFTKVTTFVAEEAKRLVHVLLSRWDLHNLKTLLRGRHIGVSADEIIESVVPAGELNQGQLNQLAQQADLKTFIDLLATWQVPYARPLLRELPKYLEKKDLSILELALDKYHYARMLAQSKGNSLHSRLVHQLAMNEIDVKNIIALLRLQGVKFEFQAKKEDIELSNFIVRLMARLHLKKEKPQGQPPGGEDIDLDNLITLIRLQGVKFEFKGTKKEIERRIKKEIEVHFVPGGKEITLKQFVDLAQKNDVEELVKGLENTSYGPVLNKVLSRYQETGSLSALERRLEENLVEKAINMYNKGPLCIGIIIGYIWMKFNEIVNLRIISRCKSMGVPERKIREEIILV